MDRNVWMCFVLTAVTYIALNALKILMPCVNSFDIYVTVVSVEDALRQEATSDLMSSCLIGCFRCKCDLILFLTGAGSTQWCQKRQRSLLCWYSNPWWCLAH